MSKGVAYTFFASGGAATGFCEKNDVSCCILASTMTGASLAFVMPLLLGFLICRSGPLTSSWPPASAASFLADIALVSAD